MKVKLHGIEECFDQEVVPTAINFLVAMGMLRLDEGKGPTGSDPGHSDRYVLADKYAKKNWAICTRCQTFLLSEHRHDFVKCNCQDDKYIFIDGGDDYCRAGGDPNQFYRR